ncbi:MAG: HlyD family efflux transporter periplasmic adaptor subunit [Actinobacteria bacterium]|nr:HlyD family efflux transporter periplasmic adaptor subunit [Actinomycetota bacterium]
MKIQDRQPSRDNEQHGIDDGVGNIFPVGDRAEGTIGGNSDMIDAQALSDMQAFKTLETKRNKKKKQKRIKIIIAIIVVVLLLCAGSIWYFTSKVNQAMGEIAVVTDTVQRGTFSNDISGSGALEPYSSLVVTPEVDGIIDAINVSEGSTVSAGTVLFTITNSELDKAVTQASQGVKEADNGVKQAELNLDAAYTAYDAGLQNQEAADAAEAERARNYAKAVAAGEDPSRYAPTVITSVFDEAVASQQIESAKLGVSSAKLALESARQNYDSAVLLAQKRTVTSPMAGSVIALGVESGVSLTSVTASGKVPCQIADLSKMKMTMQVNEIDITDVVVGQSAKVTFSAVSNLELDAVVTSIATTSAGNAASSLSGGSGVVTYAVELLIDKPDVRLKPGMTAKATIVTQQLENVLMVPISAVKTDESGEKYLIVQINPETLETENRYIKVITSNSTTSVVEGDIEEGAVIQMDSGLLDNLDAISTSTDR